MKCPFTRGTRAVHALFITRGRLWRLLRGGVKGSSGPSAKIPKPERKLSVDIAPHANISTHAPRPPSFEKLRWFMPRSLLISTTLS